jgi:hypothetical protein
MNILDCVPQEYRSLYRYYIHTMRLTRKLLASIHYSRELGVDDGVLWLCLRNALERMEGALSAMDYSTNDVFVPVYRMLRAECGDMVKSVQMLARVGHPTEHMAVLASQDALDASLADASWWGGGHEYLDALVLRGRCVRSSRGPRDEG